MLRGFGAKIGENNFIYPSAKIWAPWLLETDELATIGPRVSVYNVDGLYLGHHAVVSEDAFLCGATHDIHDPDFQLIVKPLRIEAHAWVCARAVVLPGVTCREGSVLGAASVTAHDLDPWTAYAGNPARPICKRDWSETEPLSADDISPIKATMDGPPGV